LAEEILYAVRMKKLCLCDSILSQDEGTVIYHNAHTAMD